MHLKNECAARKKTNVLHANGPKRPKLKKGHEDKNTQRWRLRNSDQSPKGRSHHDVLPLTGKPSMIVFFNTACTDCRKELPIVQELFEEFSDRANFMAISRAEGRESVAAYWEKEKLEIPYSAQTDRNVFALFAKTTIPRIYIADASGTVKYIFIEKASKKKLVRALEDLLQVAT